MFRRSAGNGLQVLHQRDGWFVPGWEAGYPFQGKSPEKPMRVPEFHELNPTQAPLEHDSNDCPTGCRPRCRGVLTTKPSSRCFESLYIWLPMALKAITLPPVMMFNLIGEFRQGIFERLNEIPATRSQSAQADYRLALCQIIRHR